MDLWDYHKISDICVIGVLEREEREGGAEKVFKEKWLKTSQMS